MTFEEACDLARAIEGNSKFAVIAIGRFVLQTELQGAHRGGFLAKLPWGVSAIAIDNPQYPTVLRSEDAWREFAACSKPVEPVQKPVQAAPAVVATAQPTAKQGQLSLF